MFTLEFDEISKSWTLTRFSFHPVDFEDSAILKKAESILKADPKKYLTFRCVWEGMHSFAYDMNWQEFCEENAENADAGEHPVSFENFCLNSFSFD